jgi:hypothetical protein
MRMNVNVSVKLVSFWNSEKLRLNDVSVNINDRLIWLLLRLGDRRMRRKRLRGGGRQRRI